MSLTAIAALAENFANDIYTLDDTNSIIISCQNRANHKGLVGGTIRGILAAPLSFGAQASYQPFMNQGGFSQLVSKVDSIVSFAGMTIQQPWFSRKYWVSTSPLTFNLKMVFIANTDAKTDVYDKVEALFGFLYPRLAMSNDASGVQLYIPPGPNLFTYEDSEGKIRSRSGDIVSSVSEGMSKAVDKFFGDSDAGQKTSEFFNKFSKAAESGPDAVSLTIGATGMTLKVCYLENVNVTFSQTTDSSGYPHYAEVTANVSSFDNCYVNTNGVFKFNRSEVLNDFIGAVIDKFKSVVSGGGTS